MVKVMESSVLINITETYKSSKSRTKMFKSSSRFTAKTGNSYVTLLSFKAKHGYYLTNTLGSSSEEGENT